MTTTTKPVERVMENVLMTVDTKKQKLKIEIDLKGFDIDSMLSTDLSSYAKTKQDNYRVASSMGNIALKAAGYEHLRMGLNVYGLEAPIQDEIKKRKESADIALARKENADRTQQEAGMSLDSKVATLMGLISSGQVKLDTLPEALRNQILDALSR